METSLCSTCLIYFQRALSSPVGEAVSSYLKSLNPPLPDEYNFLSILEKLRRNEYNTPEDWLVDLDHNVEKSLRFFGEDSEISISILSIQHNIKEMTKGLLKGDDEKWKNAKNKLFSALKDFIKTVPNDELEFKELVGQTSAATFSVEPFIPSDLTLQNEKIDLIELKLMIQNLKTDEDYSNLWKIVSHYEPEYSNAKGAISCEIKNFHPYTLRLMKEYVMKHAPPLPPQKISPCNIPRMRSAPIPQNPNDMKSVNITKNETTTSTDNSKVVIMPNPITTVPGILSPNSIAATSPFLKINSPSPPKTKNIWEESTDDTTTISASSSRLENLTQLDPLESKADNATNNETK